MDEAFDLAREALAAGEVPIGCVFTHQGSIVARSRNTVTETKNGTRHAELNCIDQVLEANSKEKAEQIFREMTVIATVEPCILCLAALRKLGVRNLIYGCSNDKFGGCGSVLDIHHMAAYDGELAITKGVRAEEAINLIKTFYTGLNPNAPITRSNKKKKLESSTAPQ
ncbi:ADAT2 [Cordylochernes scorpioides]|uniref:ADAT2 n=1 Tax=Cordylochernes scorpioides TaxID=51811 RepID=A0ABY6JUJ9_9ARAC|nr:ADAT2 [Cordylochernes scorpioides]